MKKAVILMTAILGIGAFELNAKDTYGAEFRTMRQCVDGIKRHSNSKLKILTDKPNRVVGVILKWNTSFSCTRKSTGTKGVYYQGIFQK